MSEGGIIAQSLEIDEFYEYVRVLQRIAVVIKLSFDNLNLSIDDFFLGRFVFCLTDQLDEIASLAGEDIWNLFFLKDCLHV